ncbi:MAG: ribbon-helix-helix protein, CopG family [Actinomycetota bacterium]
MATLDRRVQILLDPAQYAALEHEASVQKQSVASLIREAVDERLNRSKQTKVDALARLFARADAQPAGPPIDWEVEKESFERDFLRDLP